MLNATTVDPSTCPGDLPDVLVALDQLVSGEGGLIGRVTRISGNDDGLQVYSAAMGELEHLHANIRSTSGRPSGVELGGGGGGLNPRLARAIAIAEALERYSSCVVPDQLL